LYIEVSLLFYGDTKEKFKSEEFLGGGAGNHRNGIPWTDLHAQRAAGAGVVVGFYVGGVGIDGNPDKAVVPGRHRNAGLAAGALVIVNQGDPG
jgi:hypothetical protein